MTGPVARAMPSSDELVMFTLDTETGFRDVVLINASYGLGEPIVQGSVTPDEYCVFKPPLQQDLRPIIRRTVGSKEFKLVYDEGGTRAVKTVPVAGGVIHGTSRTKTGMLARRSARTAG